MASRDMVTGTNGDQDPGISRRRFLQRAAQTGAALGVLAIPGALRLTEAAAAPQAPQALQSDQLIATINRGVESRWGDVDVVPALIVLRPGARFYNSPTLQQELIVPNPEGLNLLVRAPILPGKTLGHHPFDGSDDNRPLIQQSEIAPNAWGVQLPGTNRLAYFSFMNGSPLNQLVERTVDVNRQVDRQRMIGKVSVDTVALSTPQNGATDVDSQRLVVKSRSTRSGVPYVLGYNKPINGGPTIDVPFGSSVWADDATTSIEIAAFQASETYEPTLLAA